MRASTLTATFMALMIGTNAFAADEPDQVTMQLKDFLELYEKTRDPIEKPEKAPRDYSLASASYSGSGRRRARR